MVRSRFICLQHSSGEEHSIMHKYQQTWSLFRRRKFLATPARRDFHDALGCSHSQGEGELITMLQCCQSLVLHVSKAVHHFTSSFSSIITKRETGNNMKSWNMHIYSASGTESRKIPHLMWTTPRFGGSEPQTMLIGKNKDQISGELPSLKTSFTLQQTVVFLHAAVRL